MDKRGQFTAEFILLVGFIMVIILLVVSFITPQMEQNTVMSAARDGASSAVAEITFLDSSTQPIRVTKLNVTGNTNKTVRIMFSGTVPSKYQDQVLNKTVQTVAEQGFTIISSNAVKGTSFTYTFVIG